MGLSLRLLLSTDFSVLGLPILYGAQWAAPFCRRLHWARGIHIIWRALEGGGLQQRKGSQPKKRRGFGHLTLPSLRGPGSSAGGHGMQVEVVRRAPRCHSVPPVLHPLDSYSFCGSTPITASSCNYSGATFGRRLSPEATV